MKKTKSFKVAAPYACDKLQQLFAITSNILSAVQTEFYTCHIIAKKKTKTIISRMLPILASRCKKIINRLWPKHVKLLLQHCVACLQKTAPDNIAFGLVNCACHSLLHNCSQSIAAALD